MPLPSGSDRSSSTMSGWRKAYCLRASCRLPAVAVEKPSADTSSASISAEFSSSSTISACAKTGILPQSAIEHASQMIQQDGGVDRLGQEEIESAFEGLASRVGAEVRRQCDCR